ncbi:putative calcium-transporting ATPase 13, plasma membrane-type [Vitis vinifera]|uniref:Putative calcium-transporting ATPase 13, plasma membrane-type n=1 Tax=Vitis vinifera TaxID=29760 RepID=A0A438E5E8_VITVI|nr:putative calcium-transporting ATPase 13, plasma membrane-type [Vitis vinifera]
MLDDPTTVSKPSKRWRLASATTPSSVVLNVQPDAFSDIDKTSLNANGSFRFKHYQRQPAKSLIHFAVEACKDLTNLVLLLCATLSLGFGIKEQGLKEGWYDSASIFVAVLLVISVSAVSNFWQNRQSQRLSKVSNNIKVDVVRNGRSDQQTSIFDIVVGDVVCVKSGDQVPADGLFLNGHSLQVDESSMTGKGGCVEVNSDKNPFLLV